MGIAKELGHLQTRINAFDRAYHRALMDLTRLQKERARAAGSPENGFVPPEAGQSSPAQPAPGTFYPEYGTLDPHLASFRKWREANCPPETVSP